MEIIIFLTVSPESHRTAEENYRNKKQKSFLRIKEEFFKEIRKTELKEKIFF